MTGEYDVTIDDSMQTSVKAQQKGKKTRAPWTMPTEVDYYGKMLRSIRGKKYEVYAVSRIMHLLDDPEIELITQKPVLISDGSMALLDLYLPQFKIGIEVDEGHDFAKGSQGGRPASRAGHPGPDDVRGPTLASLRYPHATA